MSEDTTAYPSTPLKVLNENLDEVVSKKRQVRGGILASPDTYRQHTQNLKELEQLNVQNSKLRRDIQRVQRKSTPETLKQLKEEKMATTIEIWHRKTSKVPADDPAELFDEHDDVMETYATEIKDLRDHIRQNDAKLEQIKAHCDRKVDKANLELQLSIAQLQHYKDNEQQRSRLLRYLPLLGLLVALIYYDTLPLDIDIVRIAH